MTRPAIKQATVDADVLVASPGDLLTTRVQRRLAALVIGGFLALCAGGGLLDLVSPAEPPLASGPERAREQRKRDQARILDGTRMALWGQEHQDRSNLRAALVPWYLVFLVEVLREGNEEMMIGPDGWTFLWSRVQPWSSARYGRHAVENDTRLPELAARVLRSVDRRLASLGVEALFLPIPRKSVMAASHLPRGIDPFADFDLTVLARLAQSGIPHVNLFEEFEGWPVADLWHAHDAHWTQRAQSLAAEAVQSHWQIGPLAGERAAVEIEQPTSRPRTDNLMTLGIPRDHQALDYIHANEVPDLVLYDRDPRGGIGARARFPKRPAEPEWAVVGTSFTTGDCLRQYLANDLGTAPLNHARRGIDTLETLAETLATPGATGPSRWLIEIPLYQLFFPDGRNGGLMVGHGALALQRATGYVRTAHLHDLDKGEYSGRGPIQIEAGDLVHDGDGAVQLELTCERAPDRNLTLKVRKGATSYRGQWKKGARSARLTLFAHERSLDPLVVRFAPRRNFGAITVRALTEYDLANGQQATAGTMRVGASGDGWIQEFRFPEAVTLDRHHSLVLRTHASHAASLSVELLPADPSIRPRELGDLHLLPDAVALISAGGPGGPFGAVRILGTGPMNSVGVDVQLVNLFAPR